MLTKRTSNLLRATLLAALSTISTWQNHALAGGVFNGGGGGNTPTAPAARNHEMVRVTKTAKAALRAWLTDKYFEFQQSTCPNNSSDYLSNLCATGAKLFNQPLTIFDILAKTEIELKFNDPCPDADGRPKDGSVFGSKPGSICLSLRSIQAKTNKLDYENQLASLILHEISHLAGTDEAEAENLQKELLYVAFKATPEDTVWSNAHNASINSKTKFDADLDQWKTDLDTSKGLAGSCELTRQMADKALGFHNERIDSGSGFIHFGPNQERIFWSSYVNLRAMSDYLCSVDTRNTIAERAKAKAAYKEKFKHLNAISAQSYAADLLLAPYLSRLPQSAMIRKITSLPHLRQTELEILGSFKSVVEWSQSESLKPFRVFSNDCEVNALPAEILKNCPL